MLRSGVYIYTCPGVPLSGSPLSSSSKGTGGVLGWGGARCSAGAPVPLPWHRDCGFSAVPLWQEWQLAVWFSQTIAGGLSIGADTSLCAGDSTPRFFLFQSSSWGFLIRCGVSSIAEHETAPLAILAIFKARHMSDFSSCTRSPCLAIAADILKPYLMVVAAFEVRCRYYHNHIRLLSFL